MPEPTPPAKTGAAPGEAGATGTPLTPKIEPEGVNITLDGRPVTARKGELLIAAAERAGTYIPRFCYHPRMKPVGMCRMCLVEIKGPRGPSLSPACFIAVTEGMDAVTDSPRVKKAQDGVLEFLLVNHPLDCPVCDKGGECPLQDQTLAYGPGETRYVEEKRHWDKPVPLSPLVLIDRERCIQCARCTRFAEEVAGDAGIDFASRSDTTEVAIYPGEPFSSNFSGNIVQICPVGALLAKPYRFKARPWDLEQVETTCTLCAVGCRVAAQSSADQVVRFIGVDSDPVNWGWLCDKGRFGFEALNSPLRLAEPLSRLAGEGQGASGASGAPLSRTSWAAAYEEIASRLAGVPGERTGVIGGARLPNEDAYAWAKFARTVLHTDNIDAQLGDGLPADVVASLPRATIDQICSSALIVAIAPDIKEELPVLYLRLRDAIVEKGVPLLEISPVPTGLTSRASHSLRYRPGELAPLVQALCGAAPIEEAVGGVPAADAERARLAISEAGGAAKAAPRPGERPALGVVVGRPSLAESSDGPGEAALLLATIPGAIFLPALRRSNVHGAIDMGLAPGLLPGRIGLEEGRSWYEEHWASKLPRKGLGTIEMLAAAAAGRLDVLFLVGADPVADCPDAGLARRALSAARFVVGIDAFSTQSLDYADVVLPASVYTERRGSFTNVEGRVTWLGQKVTAPGTARPDWMIVQELASRLGAVAKARSPEDIWAEVQVVSPLHAGATSALLKSRQGRNGIVVPVPPGRSSEAEVPPPLDPMADPGIASAEIHPAPPVALSVEGPGVGRANEPSAGPQDLQAQGGAVPRRLMPRPPAAALAARPAQVPEGRDGPATALTVRLVTHRPMWDGGVLVQNSPSLANLHPSPALGLSPADARRLGEGVDAVRVSNDHGAVVLAVRVDAGLPEGSASLPFNLPGGSAAELIAAGLPYTDVVVEPVAEPARTSS